MSAGAAGPNIRLAPDTSIGSPVVVGRAEFVAAFSRLLDAAVAGNGQVITIGGEAGIGKSRLVRELQGCARAAAQPVVPLLLQGHCFERDEMLPYAPILDLLRACMGMQTDHDLAACLGEQAGEVIKLLPELAARLPGVVPTPPLEPEQEKRRAFDALARMFSRMAAERPLVIVFEDLHWSDDTSLEFLLYFARRAVQERILLLLTYRADEVTPALAHFLAALDRGRLALDWPLEPLSRAEVQELVIRIFDLPQAPRAEFTVALHELTEGNPFFIEEVLKSMVAAGDIFYANGAWDRKPLADMNIPRSVHDAVRQRTNLLSEASQRVLVLAAVAGRRFDFELLASISGRTEEALLPLVKELIAAQLVVEESEDRFAFRHALTQQAVYSDLLGRERRVLHGEIAGALHALHGDADQGQYAALAHHYYEAAQWPAAYEYAARAGDRARRMYAAREAVAQYDRAVQAAENAGIAVPGSLHCARGTAYESLGEFEQALASYRAALECAHANGDRLQEWEALISLGSLWAMRDYERTGEHFRRALDLARASGDERLLARSLNRLGNWLTNVGQPAEGLEEHAAALEIATTVGDAQLIAETDDLMGMATGMLGRMADMEAHYDAAIARFRKLGDDAGLSSSLASQAIYASGSHSDTVVHPATMKPASALDRADEALAVAQRIGSASAISFAQWVRGVALAYNGQLSAGLASALAGLHTAEEAEHQQWAAGANFSAGELLWLMRDAATARQHLEASYESAKELKSGWWIANSGCNLVLACLMTGDIERAQEIVDECSDPSMRAQGVPERRLIWARAEMALAAGDAADALAVIEKLIAAAEGGEQRIPRLEIARGRSLIALGKLGEAEAAFDAACTGAEERDDRFSLWEASARLGHVQSALGRDGPGAQAFNVARRIIEELADGIDDSEQRRRFIESAYELLPSKRAPTPRQAAKQAAGGLTEREMDVATEITRGCSNREIAAQLVLSERTVETHVGNILSKLGFSSRSQIAAWGAERRLTGAPANDAPEATR